MLTLALLGLVGGLITGVSPRVLPMLPIIFFAGGSAKKAAAKPAAPRVELADGPSAVRSAEPAG